MTSVRVFAADGDLRAALLARFPMASHGIDPRSPEANPEAFLPAECHVLPMFREAPPDLAAAGNEAFTAVDFLKDYRARNGAWPKCLVALVPDRPTAAGRAGEAALRSFLAYASAQTLGVDCSFNAFRYPPTEAGAGLASDAALCVSFGLLDDMRGEFVVLRES